MTKKCLSTLFLTLGLWACGQSSGPGGAVSGRGRALVITSDFQDGSYSLIDMQDFSTAVSLARIHPDAVCRYDPLTRTPFIVSRLGADAVEVLDPENAWRVAGEYSVGPGSNPQDIAVVSSQRAYVLRYAEPGLLVVDPARGDRLGRLDLGQYADSDGVPEAAWALVLGDRVFVALQRLDGFLPSDYSSLLVLDARSGDFQREIRLTGTNPFPPLRHVPALDRIAVGEAGRLGRLDGGLELLAPDAGGPAGFAVSEEALGGDLVDAVVVDARRGYAISGIPRADGQMNTEVVRFDPRTGEVRAVLLEARGFDHPFLELSPDASQLWVAQRTRSAPGVRVFSVEDDRELTPGPIDTGLPPYMLCFVPE